MMVILAVSAGIMTLIGVYYTGAHSAESGWARVEVSIAAGVNGARMQMPLSSPFKMTHKPPRMGVLAAADGALQSIRLFNKFDQVIGSEDGWLYVPSGKCEEWVIALYGGEEQVAYIQLEATTDAICVPLVALRGPDETEMGWLGDWGRECGLKWFMSNYKVSEESNYRPACTWLDYDGSSGIQVAKLKIHLPSFNRLEPPLNRTEVHTYCHKPYLQAWTIRNDIYTRIRRGINEQDGYQGSHWLQRRGMSKFQSQLVISNQQAHNATDLCLSPTSVGPSFVSLHQGLFCDMETRQLLPLCVPSQIETQDCFDMQEKKALMKRSQDSRLGARHETFQYRVFEKVTQWE
ncbi:hypothetical protein CDD81_7861 [Ophiocordyceps australis]|uniref:Uncharacterized protein n=1 Tax=Ophiocordyceps australis TaxID=1399860 RepID=A0A2C5XLA4_9HYPO|nr:hypothetical protein CDD81_7861 [Ophiocordyceps australis]